MAKTPVQLQQIDSALAKQLGSFVDLPKIDVPFTTIVKRAQVTDFSQDLMPRMGIERIHIQNIQEVQDEVGPNGERVWSAVNDIHNQFRFVGSWANDPANLTRGPHPISSVLNDYIEIAFYGTGLNFLGDDNSMDLRATVDGGAEGANFFPTNSAASSSRNYNARYVVNVVSGLTLGFHTVKIRLGAANDVLVNGFEILNEASTIKTTPGSSFLGSKKLSLATLDSQSYVPTSPGTRGGRVVAYLDSDGSIQKAFTPTNTTQLNLTAANHTNEELIRTYHWREFGAGRADDFSTLTSSVSDRVFTLDDGTTTLVGNDVRFDGGFLDIQTVGTGFVDFTFVGTGLDIITSSDGTSSGTNIWTVSVDGSSIGTISDWTNGVMTIRKIVSGLPYGTHTVRLFLTAEATHNMYINKFNVYGPKKPTIPVGAMELADYYLMGDFVANTTNGLNTISTGVLRKYATREIVTVNGTGGAADWGFGFNVATQLGGFELASDRTNAYAEYTFFGTGFDLRFIVASTRSANVSVSLQSLSTGGSLLAATTANFPSLLSSVYGTGAAFAAGVLDQQDAGTSSGSGLVIRNLPLGLWKVRFNNNVASTSVCMNAIDIITPIHSPKSNLPSILQNTLSVGSNSIGDSRILAETQDLDIPNWAQAIGITSNPTTTSTILVPLVDMFCVIKTEGGPLEISFSAAIENSSAGAVTDLLIYVNEVATSYGARTDADVAARTHQVSGTFIYPVAAGTHTVQLYWRCSAGTAQSTNYNITNVPARYLRVKEVKE